MALFLSESLAQRVPTVSIEEGLIGLMEVMEEGQSLTEALYKADFVMFLREAEGENIKIKEVNMGSAKYKNKGGTDSSMNFLERAWEAIKNFGRKLWQKLSALFQAIKNKLTLWWNKLTGNKSDNFKVRKQQLGIAKEFLRHIENLTIIQARKYKEKSDLEEAKTAEDTRHDEAIKKFENTEGLTEVSKSELIALAKNATELLNKSERTKSDQEATKTALDSQVKAYKDNIEKSKESGASKDLSDDKEKIEKAMGIAQAELRISSALGTMNSKVVNAIMQMVRQGALESQEMSDTDYNSIRTKRGA